MNVTVPENVLQDILARLARVEQSQAQPPAEALVPNSYTIDSSGNVSVPGIDLPAGTISTPPDTDRIRWIRQSDGGVVAGLWGFSNSGTEALSIVANALAGPDTSEILISAVDNSNQVRASVGVIQAAGGATAEITAQTGAHAVTVLNQAGTSSFLQAGDNLADVANTATARSNLGLDTAATHPATDFLETANHLSELPNSTGSSTVTLGHNSPASNTSGPWGWFQANMGGTTVWIPAWK